MGVVPVLRSGPDPTPEEVAAAIRQLLAGWPGLNAFVEAQHGIFSVAPTIEAAAYGADLVEETAQVAVLSSLMRVVEDVSR